MHLTTARAAFLVSVALVIYGWFAAPAAYSQDYTIGANARAFGMGGAGIALSHFLGSDGRSNPASLAFEKNNVTPTFPTYGVRSTGPANANAGSGYLLGGINSSNATSLAAQYGSADSSAGVNVFASLRFGKFEVSSNAVGEAHMIPNAAWQNWVVNGQDEFNTLPPNGQEDIYAAGYYTLPSLAYANTIPGAGGDHAQLAVGLRVKNMIGIYSHQIVETGYDAVGQHSVINVDSAPEMHGATTLTKTGFGADMGLLLRPKSLTGVSFGLVVNNFVKPNFTFDSISTTGQVLNRFNILQESVTAGLAWEAKTGLTVVADMDCIGGGKDLEGNPTQDERVGIEQRFLHVIAIRGGYSKVYGAMYGVGFFGLDVAAGHNVPLEVTRTLNF